MTFESIALAPVGLGPGLLRSEGPAPVAGYFFIVPPLKRTLWPATRRLAIRSWAAAPPSPRAASRSDGAARTDMSAGSTRDRESIW